MHDITLQVNAIADRVHELRVDQSRLLVALAGAPCSGKTTLATELCRRLTSQKVRAVVIPMDGFHLDNAVLEDRDMKHRKGARDL